MGKKLKMSNCAIIISTIAASIAAIASAFVAIKALSYTKELNKPILSLIKTDIIMELKWNFLDIKFEFENVGSEPLKITKFLLGLYDSNTNKFIYKEIPPLVNILPMKQTFVYREKFNINDQVSEKVLKYMEDNFPEGKIYDQHPKIGEIRRLFGKSIIIFNIEYEGTTKLSRKTIPFKHFLVFDGTRTYQLSLNEYIEIKEQLPEGFTIE